MNKTPPVRIVVLLMVVVILIGGGITLWAQSASQASKAHYQRLAGEVPNEADLNRIGASDEDNRNRAGCTLGSNRRLTVCRNHTDLTANQIGCQSR